MNSVTRSTVLVIDDTPSNLGLIVDCLEGHNVHVRIARDGIEALQRAELTQPDLILLDVMMPGIDGFETCKRLKANPLTCLIPVIFMTSLGQTEDKVLGFQAGGVDYVTKPLQVDEVAARVRTHLTLSALQKELQEQNMQLRREVETRRAAEVALNEMIQTVRNVTHSIAHDLRTPLAELRSRLEAVTLLKPTYKDTLIEVEAAVADVDRVMAIFNALLRLAEIDAGGRRAGFQVSDISHLVAEAVDFYQPLAELRNVTLSFSAAPSQFVSVDHLLIAQAVGNLIDNALKFTQSGGSINVAVTRRADGSVVITVSDNGPGIPDSEKSRVVERFYRGDASRGTPGVGLGLALVGAVASLHRGTIDLVDSNPGLSISLVMPAES